MKTFADRLLDKIDEKQNPSVVGLDPRFENIPEFIRNEKKEKYGATFKGIAASILEFNKRIIDAIKDTVPAVKPQMAFYEKYGHFGVKTFMDTAKYAKKRKLIVIEDAKRNDIGPTALAYAQGHLGEVEFWDGNRSVFDVDCITVTPYLGSDGVTPFIEQVKNFGKGIFILVKTSNPSSGEFQDIKTVGGDPNFIVMAKNVDRWGEGTEGKRGYKSVGAVVGATYPEQAKSLREIMPKSIFLIPGYGAQGGGADDVIPCFNKDGYGGIVNSSREIIFAYQKKPEFGPEKFDEAAGKAAEEMKAAISGALKKAGISPW